MEQRHRHGYLYGTMVLAAGTVVVKLIGALFKIPLTNILGGVGMSYFNVAYELYYPLYALFVSGVPVAVSKLVSESMACGRARDARKLLRVAGAAFLAVGAAGSLLMFFGAGWFSARVQNPGSVWAVRMLSPALFFGCLMAALRGYWQGMQDMAPTAVSQIVEAVAKLAFGLALSYGVTVAGLRQFSLEGTVFGAPCASAQEAQIAVLPYAAAGAILGVTVSTLCGAVYMAARHRLGRGAITPEQWKASPPAAPSRALLKRLVAIAVPVCVASLITNLTSFIDLISVMNRLGHAITRHPGVIEGIYEGLIPGGVGREMLASYLYGCYSGLAVPVYNLVPSLTTTIGVSLLPAVSAAWAVRDRRALERNVASALRLASLIAMPAGLGICAMAGPVLRLLFFSKPMESAVISPALHLMGLSAIFVALSLPVNAILQAVGRADLPVKLLLAGGGLKLVLNFLLVAVPRLNIQAAPVGTLVCYAFVLFVSFGVLVNSPGVRIPVGPVFGKPFFAAVCCAVGAWAANGLLERVCGSQLAAVGGVSIGVVIYVFVVLLTKTVTKEDILMVPGGEKFAKLLEKRSLLG